MNKMQSLKQYVLVVLAQCLAAAFVVLAADGDEFEEILFSSGGTRHRLPKHRNLLMNDADNADIVGGEEGNQSLMTPLHLERFLRPGNGTDKKDKKKTENNKKRKKVDEKKSNGGKKKSSKKHGGGVSNGQNHSSGGNEWDTGNDFHSKGAKGGGNHNDWVDVTNDWDDGTYDWNDNCICDDDNQWRRGRLLNEHDSDGDSTQSRDEVEQEKQDSATQAGKFSESIKESTPASLTQRYGLNGKSTKAKSTKIGNSGSTKWCSCNHYKPTKAPTSKPSLHPTSKLTPIPTQPPTVGPTSSPSRAPSGGPTSSPSRAPSGGPTSSPSRAPSGSPTNPPSGRPTSPPTLSPTSTPSRKPTHEPTSPPTHTPTNLPTSEPTKFPTQPPTPTPN